MTRPRYPPLRSSSEFLEKLFCGSALAGQEFLPTLGDVGADLRIVEFKVVLELIDVHEAGERDAVLLEDDVRLAEVDPLHDGAEAVPSLGEGETFNPRTRLRGFDGYQLLWTDFPKLAS